MRAPTLTCAVLVAATLVPSLVAGVPLFNAHQTNIVDSTRQPTTGGSTPSQSLNVPRSIPAELERHGQSIASSVRSRSEPVRGVIQTLPSTSRRKTFSHSTLYRRTSDEDTSGGNAYTGSTGDVSGGSIENVSETPVMPTIMNINSNNGGAGGYSESGCASGGKTNDSGAAGNAYSGSTGNAEGGKVSGVGGMVNWNSNNAGNAGVSKSGCATGGNVGYPKASSERQDMLLRPPII
ncbi:uncharacterized protein FIBRA_04908 [Fibroporia radiculosa]|uniref:Uncharacterized protein n=1 Tax=Fibroporia radiculosa TaxID=599839 RepID=J4HWT0_9APHY|nr:uncharacterized protein FIBRA_04908 [Fibroporia radiculosa]CCM02797.1 predicted protein [Fibroporia radiculosa]